MPAIKHEPWCQDHDGETGVGAVGVCNTSIMGFGARSRGDALPDPVGAVHAYRIDEDEMRISIDYRTTRVGEMNLDALRALHEALQESPQELVEAVAALVEHLGDAVPPAHSEGPGVAA